MRTTTIVFTGTMKELKENLEQLDILFPKQTLAQIYEVTGLLKDSNVEEEQFIQAPAKVVKKTAKKRRANKAECCICGHEWETTESIESFVCPDCKEGLLYNISIEKYLSILQDRLTEYPETPDDKMNAILDIQELKIKYKNLFLRN